MSNITELPQNVALNLDEYENPDAKAEPFRTIIAGRVIEMADPAELDWQDLLDIDSPLEFLRFAVSKDDRDFLYEQKIPGFKFNKLMDSYQKYYGIDDKIAELRRAQRR